MLAASCSPDPATKHGAWSGCPRALGVAGTKETSWTSGLLFQELMPQGEPTSLQPDNTHSALYFSMFCFLPLLCSAPDVPHTPANSLWWLETQPGSTFVLFMISQEQTQGKDSCPGLQLEDEGQGGDTACLKKEEGGWSLLHHPVTTDADTENLPCEGWTQLSMQASFCTTQGWWDLNHSNTFLAELLPCKSHYPAADTGQFTSHIFCSSVKPWREA